MKPEVVSSACVRAFTIPTATPEESDGTLEWKSTTLVIVQLMGCGHEALGYGYADTATALLIRDVLLPLVVDCDALAPEALQLKLRSALRNLGLPGIASMALSIVDVALWDLKSKILGRSLFKILGARQSEIPAYGSGGFTSYTETQLKTQVAQWVEQGLKMFKIKIGRDKNLDRIRVKNLRQWIGDEGEIFVDANGAYQAKEACAEAHVLKDFGVTWFEEPVIAENFSGLAFVRDHAPAEMNIAAGEYGYETLYFQKMLQSQCVDVLQADATRCGGVTGFLKAATLASASRTPLSAHTAPSLHAHLCCAAEGAIHVEYFFDHARIEGMLFEGALSVHQGQLKPNSDRLGLGLEVKEKEAAHYEVKF